MKYSITKYTKTLVVTLDTESGKYSPRVTTFNDPNVILGNNDICLLENGEPLIYLQKHEIDLIDGVEATNLVDAVSKIEVVINSLKLLVTPKFKGSVVPTDTPQGTDDAFWIATQAGTYTLFGNFVLPANNRAEISRVNGVFSVSMTAFDITSKVNVSDIVDNLTTDSNIAPASARQVKVLNEKLAGGVVDQTLVFDWGGISSTTGLVDGNFAQKHTSFIPLEGVNYLNYYGMRGYEGSGYSFLALYDVNNVFIISVTNCDSSGTIRQGTVDLVNDYPTAKFIRIACSSNPEFLAVVTLGFGVVGLQEKIHLNKTEIQINATEIDNAKTLISNLETNKVNQILRKKKLYTENLVAGANVTTSNAKTLSNFYPSIINNEFNSAVFRPSVEMIMAPGNYPNQFYSTPNVARVLGYTIEFKFTGQFLEIAGRETYYWFTLMVNGVVVVKNFDAGTSTAGYDGQGKLWTKVDLGVSVTDANVKLFINNTFGGVATNGTISLWSANRLKIIADGDSIFEGTGAGVGASNSSTTNIYSMMGVLAYMLDLDLYDAAVGGSGFTVSGNGGEPNMVNRFATYISPYECDIFISGGGLNDGYTSYPSNVNTAVINYFTALNNRYRNTPTKVVIVSPFEPHPDAKNTHLGILGIRDKEKELCLQYGFAFIDMIDGKTYDEMGNLVQDSSATLGGLLEQGREAQFYFDGTHPNELGHNYCGRRIMQEVYRVLR